MDFSFLSSPAFWVSVFVAYVIPKLTPHIDKAIERVKSFTVERLPSSFRGYYRGRKLRKLREIKKQRWNVVSIYYQIAKANTMFLLFCGVIGLYIVLLVSGPFQVMLKLDFWIVMLIASPIFIFEIYWLNQDLKAKDLIAYNSKIRLTSRIR